MRALLLPVKDLRNAKKRLIGVLTPEERFSLAETMLADTVRAVQGVRRIEKIFVITNYEPAMQLAEENGWEILREEQQISESHSVDAASRLCEHRGVSGLLRLPLDLPLIQSADIDDLLAVECRAPSLVIVPSRDGTGTNAIAIVIFKSRGPSSMPKPSRSSKPSSSAKQRPNPTSARRRLPIFRRTVRCITGSGGGKLPGSGGGNGAELLGSVTQET